MFLHIIHHEKILIMSKYALSIILSFIFLSSNAQISQYQFSVQTKPYASLEGGTNLTAGLSEEEWEEYALPLFLPENINYEFDQTVNCPLLIILFDGTVAGSCFSENFADEYQTFFSPHSDLLDYRFSGGADPMDTEIWYKYEEGTSYIEFRNLSFYYDELNEISPDARFAFMYIIDHETGSMQYHYGPSSYNPEVNSLLADAEYVLGFAYFKNTDVIEEQSAVILLSGNPENPDVNIYENGEEPIDISFMNAIPAEGTLYSFTLNPSNTNNLDTKLTDYSLVPNPGSNEAIINNDVQTINAQLSIWNTNGQLMHHSVVLNKASIDTSSFPTGLYFFQVTTENGTQTIKWMKQ